MQNRNIFQNRLIGGIYRSADITNIADIYIWYHNIEFKRSKNTCKTISEMKYISK